MEFLTDAFEAREIPISFISKSTAQPIRGHEPFIVNLGFQWTSECSLAYEYPGPLGLKLVAKKLLTPSWRKWRTVRLALYLLRLPRGTALLFFKPSLHSLMRHHLPSWLLRRFVVIEQFHSNITGLHASGWETMYRELLPSTDAFLSVDPETAGALSRLFSFPVGFIANPWPKVTDIPLASLEDRPNRIVVVARLDTVKRLDILLRAFAIASRKLETPWQLTIWGEGPERASLAALIDHLELSEAVSLPGATSTPTDEFSTGALTAVTSRYEAGPLTLIEAGSVGVPSVCTPCSPLATEMSSTCGWIVPESPSQSDNDLVGALADTLAQAMTDKRERTAKGIRSHEFVARRDPDQVGQEWINLITSLTDSTPWSPVRRGMRKPSSATGRISL